MIDIGSSVNIIKINRLKDTVIIDKNKIYDLVGINPNIIKTMGEITLSFHGIQTLFQVGSHDFPIQQDGILGINFLQLHKIILDVANNSIKINRKNML